MQPWTISVELKTMRMSLGSQSCILKPSFSALLKFAHFEMLQSQIKQSISNSTIVIHSSSTPPLEAMCNTDLYCLCHECERETIGLCHERFGFGFFSGTQVLSNNRRITHTCQCPILKAPVYKTATTILAWAQHSDSKEGGSIAQVCLREEEWGLEIK